MSIKYYDTNGKYWGKFDETRGLFIPSEEVLADRKNEPQTDGILFKGNLKEGDYKLIKTTNGWVLEGNDIAYYGEPQTERSSE